MKTQSFWAGELSAAKVLVIGHDPRLEESDTQAEFAFFSDYFFRKVPTVKTELKKYQLAQAVYSYIAHLTSYRYSAYEMVMTNLCNDGLPHPPKGKIALIPESKAVSGIDDLEKILNQSQIELIFTMSTQVNYWLQKLGFYPGIDQFIEMATPKERGVNNHPPYYEPARSSPFKLICGQIFDKDNRRLFPILHIKNWPLRQPGFKQAYGDAYRQCINILKV